MFEFVFKTVYLDRIQFFGAPCLNSIQEDVYFTLNTLTSLPSALSNLRLYTAASAALLYSASACWINVRTYSTCLF